MSRVSRALHPSRLEDIAEGRRMPTFSEVRAIAGELMARRSELEELTEAMETLSLDLELARDTAEGYRRREEVWRRLLSPETWRALEDLVRSPLPAGRVDSGEA